MNEFSTGDYVKYVPIMGTYTAKAEETGWEEDQIFETDLEVKWRIMQAEETGVDLISEVPLTDRAGEGLVLEGVRGYNNSVELLHALCGHLYSNSNRGIIARSVTGEDIDRLAGWTIDALEKHLGEKDRDYGKEYGVKNCIPDILTGGQNEAGYSRYKSFTLLNNSKSYNSWEMPMSNTETELIGDVVTKRYWLASRYVCADADGGACFSVGNLDYGSVNESDLFFDNGSHSYDDNLIRAVVRVPFNILQKSSGTRNDPHTLKL
jgi:hypothetical protein